MGHVALYRRFRPSTFDEIVEQKHAVSALRQAVISGSIAHAYLFSGTRGTGKTSIAKIFSRAVNCLSPQNGNPCNECEICRGILDGTIMDVIEMDAASNNSVDNIRRVCDEVMFLPSRARYKVYIIDEVHMLSGGAFNALLKTLEEPPAHAIFILATTEPHRIPATIISRCQRYDFRRIPMESMIERLQKIADAQQVSIKPDALSAIASLSDGAMRDAISLLDQVSTGATDTIVRDDVLRITGVVDDTFLYRMAEAILSDDALSIISLTDQLIMDGRDIVRFTLDLAHYFRDVLVVKLAPSETQLIQASSAAMGQMHQVGEHVSEKTLMDVITRLSSLISELKWSPEIRTSFEIALLSFGFSRTSGIAISETVAQKPVLPPAPAAGVMRQPPSVSSPGATGTSSISRSIIFAPSVQPVNKVPDEPDPKSMSSYMAPPPLEPILQADSVQNTFPKQAPGMIESPAHEAVSGEQVSLEQSGEIDGIDADIYPEPPEYSDYPEPPLPPDIPLQSELSDYPSPEGPSEFPDHSSPAGSSDPGVFQGSPALESSQTEPVITGESENVSILPLSELWDVLMHRWMDSMFTDVLQLKNASIRLDDQTFCILFPDAYGPYVRSLTGRPEYKTIMKDIMTVINGVNSVVVCTTSEFRSASPDMKETIKDEQPARADWVNEMLRYAQEAGIPVETLEEL